MAVAGVQAPPLLDPAQPARAILPQSSLRNPTDVAPGRAATFQDLNMSVTMTDNIVNRRGGINSSLYQLCLLLRQRLARVPDFDPYLDEMEQEEQEEDADTDPVTSMWNMLRRGQPLLAIFNSVGPDKPLLLQASKLNPDKFGKQATFMFLTACMKELGFPAAECFIVTDLYGTDTTGFVKVLNVVIRVLQIAEERGRLLPASSEEHGLNDSKPKSHAENVINEIVTTERDYVQHLETLQRFQTYLQQANVLPGDTIHSIFMNLNALLDFQRRFLIRVEQQNSLDPSIQNWGQLFHMYQEPFRVYEPFIANQTRCTDTVSREWEKIRSAQLPPSFQGMIETQSVLLGFLLKPFQRLVKYPMLLDSLIKKGDYDDERVEDLRLGIQATNAILESANEAVAREARVAASHDLQVSVDDWKGHKLTDFGELLIFGGHTVLKGDGNKEVERDYKIYLFEKILLCCKDVNPNKAKNKLSVKSLQRGKQRLQLKGRIWVTNVTDIVAYTKNNAYVLHVYWRSDTVIENFVVRFMNVEQRDKWSRLLQEQRHNVKRQSPHGSVHSQGATLAASQHGDHYSISGTTLVGPYDDEDGEDDDIRYTPTNSMSSNGLPNSRTASNTSLRSRERSTTGSSGQTSAALAGRMPPARFPMPEAHGQNGQGLTLVTGFQPGVMTPSDRDMQSYFSPTGESPSSSSRTSQASTYPFPNHSSKNSWMADRHMTAPPPARPTPEENGYASRAQRPSLPAQVHGQYQHAPLLKSRTRSASSPQPPAVDGRGGGHHVKTPNDDEPIPPLPSHVAQLRGPVNRSQSNSPTDTYRSSKTSHQHQQPPPLSRIPQSFPIGIHDAAAQGGRLDSRHQQQYHHGHTSSRVVSPAPAGYDGYQSMQLPPQLRVKVCFAPYPSHVTIVAPNIIRYQSLVDRIDSKMERVTASSISKGSARLKYKDTDGDLITIGNDEDVRSAIEEWIEENGAALQQQLSPDFELHWVEVGAPHPR